MGPRSTLRFLLFPALILISLASGPRMAAASSPPEPEGLQHPVYRFTEPIRIPDSVVSPDYPEGARKRGLGARVVLQVTVGRTGMVTEIWPVSTVILEGERCTPPDDAARPGIASDSALVKEFEAAAAEAVSKWEYFPGLQDGVPVASIQLERVLFCPRPEGPVPRASPKEGPYPAPPREDGEEGTTGPELMPESKVPPRFPDRGRIRGVGARVVLEVIVGKSGEARDFEVLETRALDPVRCEPADDGWWERKVRFPPNASGGFEREAWIAARRWRFRPALREGVPVEGRTRVEVEFCVDRMVRPLL